MEFVVLSMKKILFMLIVSFVLLNNVPVVEVSATEEVSQVDEEIYETRVKLNFLEKNDDGTVYFNRNNIIKVETSFNIVSSEETNYTSMSI